jgi:hypothetical protein
MGWLALCLAGLASLDGEASLRAVAERLASMRDRHVLGVRWRREAVDGVYQPDQSWELFWKDSTTFRFEFADYWGECLSLRSSGGKLWRSDQPAIDALPFPQSHPRLALDGDLGSPFQLLMLPWEDLKRQVQAESKVQVLPDGLAFRSVAFGEVRIVLDRNGFPKQILWDGRPQAERLYRQFPQWYPEPSGVYHQLDLSYLPLRGGQAKIRFPAPQR